MKKEEKIQLINSIAKELKGYNHFYLVDITGLNAESTSNLRRICFKNDIKLIMVKNTFLKKALEKNGGEYSELFSTFKGTTSIMLSNTGNAPAKLIKESKNDKLKLKAAFVEECVYVGANNLQVLCDVKSKNELIGDIIMLLQSPAKNLISALQYGQNTIAGITKTLEERVK